MNETMLPSTVFDWDSVEAVPTKSGLKRAFFKSATGTLDRLACHVTTLNPGESPHAPHQHPEEELIILKEGTLEVVHNGKVSAMGQGSVWFLAPNDLHGMRNAGTTPATYYVIKWFAPGMFGAKP